MSGSGGDTTRGAASGAALAVGGGVLLVCLAVIGATPNDAFWIADCGNKALVAERLVESGFRDLELRHPAAWADPGGIAYPMAGGFATRRGDGYASLFPPAYPALAALFRAPLGRAGLRVPAALAAAACSALLTLWLAPAIGRGAAAAAGAALGLATPLFFYGVTVWEHALAVALCLGAWLALSKVSQRRALVAGLLVGLACAFREEVALMGVALAAACYLQERSLAAPAALAAGALPPLAALATFNSAVYARPLGPHLAATPNLPVLAAALGFAIVVGIAGHRLLRKVASGRLAAALALALVGGVAAWVGLGAWLELERFRVAQAPGEVVRQAAAILAGYGASRGEAFALAGVAIASVAGGAWAARRGRGVVAAALVALAALASFAFASARLLRGDEPLAQLVLYNGLWLQLPLAGVAGIGAVRVWQQPELARLRIGVGAGLGFTLLATLLALTSQSGIFGVHWGPRWLLPGVPALVAAAAVALLAAGPGRAIRRGIWVALSAAGLAASAHATWFLAEQKRDALRLQEAVSALPVRLAVTAHPLLPEHLSPLWERVPLLFARNPETLSGLVRRFPEAGVREFALLLPAGSPALELGGWRCRVEQQLRGRRLHYLDFDVAVCRFARRPARPRRR